MKLSHFNKAPCFQEGVMHFKEGVMHDDRGFECRCMVLCAIYKHHHNTQPANAKNGKHEIQGPEVVVPALPKRARRPMQSFYAANDARAKEPIHAKVLSDSTLRRPEQIDLRAGILCMSGARVDHLANALRDDHQLQDKGEVGLVIGQNDVRNSEDLEFVFTIDKSVEKVRQEMERQPNKSLAIFMKVDETRNWRYPTSRGGIPPRGSTREGRLARTPSSKSRKRWPMPALLRRITTEMMMICRIRCCTIWTRNNNNNELPHTAGLALGCQGRTG